MAQEALFPESRNGIQVKVVQQMNRLFLIGRLLVNFQFWDQLSKQYFGEYLQEAGIPLQHEKLFKFHRAQGTNNVNKSTNTQH